MASEEFWSLTWQEYGAREERHFEMERRWDERFGLIASTFINWQGKTLKESAPPSKAGDFFGYSQADDSKDHEMTVEESIAYARAMFSPKP